MKNNSNHRGLERRLLFFVTLAFGLVFFTLHKNYQKKFEQINASYRNRMAVNLDKNVDTQLFANLLVEGNYLPDDTSAVFIAKHIKSKLAEDNLLPNLGELNKRAFRISAANIDSTGGEYLKIRLAESHKRLCITDSLPATAENTIDFGQGDCEIKAMVQEFDINANFRLRILNKNTKTVPDVLVQITEHYYDSISNPNAIILGYAMTDKNGIAVFKGLNAEGYYSVIPVRKGFEYGNSKGTTQGNLGSMKAKKRVFTFTQQEHLLSPFDTYTYLSLKEDNVITVRTPMEYQSKLITNLIFIILLWWSLHLFLCIRKKANDQLILPLIMALSGICLLVMYAIHNPLTDKMLGNDMAQGVMIGIVAITVLSEINVVTFFNSNYRFLGWAGGKRPVKFDILREILVWFSGLFGKSIKNWFSKLPEGLGYLIIALVLTSLLFPFGTGPEGSGVKVNLFFFQPGEIAKYLIIIFLAAFFYYNAEKIQTFSESFSKRGFRIQFCTVASATAGLVLLLAMYLVLGDMGPALVIAVTFIIIYSVVRGDLAQMVAGCASFVLFLFLSSWFVPHSQSVMFAFSLVWLVLWLAYGFFIHRRKQIFESAIFLNLVIAAFIFGSNLPYVGERLQARNDIYANVWDNEVRGGDQVAQGLWGLASGGTLGQGLGEGNPNLVPAFHTDMIFTSIGEELGWIGLLLIVSCLAILLYRTMLVGQRNGHPFAFYIAAGVAIITGVQFLVITLGSVGIIPLTGVAVPFLSYGKVSMIMNMTAFAIVFSISNHRSTQNQKEHLKKYDFMIEIYKYGYAVFAITLLGTLFYYQFYNRDNTLVRPALMSNVQGTRIIEYNPRIKLLMKQMDAGNIFDKNGILLATNDKELIVKTLNDYVDAGVTESIYKNELKKRKQRYYPFGNNLFFWLGDFNHTDILWNDSENDPRGYIAERRHLADLRGFDNLKYDEAGKIQQIKLTAKKDKAPFLYPIEKQYAYTDYNYSFLIPYLKAGIDSRMLEQFNKKREKRDIVLTVDAALQTKMQNEISNYISNPDLYGSQKGFFNGELWNKLRISVVILNSKTGDLLCSANYPLPNMETLKEKQQSAYNEKDLKEKAYSDRDLGLTYQTPPGSTAKVMSALAGLQKLGTAASEKTYYIDAREVVERRADGTAIEPTGTVTLNDAIVKSSNNYFINLVNDKKLYPNLDSIYQAVGIRVDKHDTKTVDGRARTFSKPLIPYFFTPDFDNEKKAEYSTEVLSVGNRGMIKYENYIKKRNKELRNPYFEKMNWHDCAWAWGQGSMSASPLNMARIVATVANNGVLAETRFVKKGNTILETSTTKTVKLVTPDEANILKRYMQNESGKHRNNGYAFPAGMGGKTGTPERDLHAQIVNRQGKKVTQVISYNDGWYIFFIDSTKENAPLAVAVRMERLGAGISGNAVRLTDKVILKVLNDRGYLN